MTLKGVIFEVDEATQRGAVKCTEERILMSNLGFRGTENLVLTNDMVGRAITFSVLRFGVGGDVRACDIEFVEPALVPAEIS